jgi:hypothetical protein
MFAAPKNSPEIAREDEGNIVAKLRKLTVATIVFVSAAIFVWVSYSSYKYSRKPESIEDIKLVRKDIAPTRIVPTNVGGEALSNQDKMIYKNFETTAELEGPKEEIKPAAKVEPIPVAKEESKPVIEVNKVEKSEVKKEKASDKKSASKATSVDAKRNDQGKKAGKSKPLNSVFDVMG